MLLYSASACSRLSIESRKLFCGEGAEIGGEDDGGAEGLSVCSGEFMMMAVCECTARFLCGCLAASHYHRAVTRGFRLGDDTVEFAQPNRPIGNSDLGRLLEEFLAGLLEDRPKLLAQILSRDLRRVIGMDALSADRDPIIVFDRCRNDGRRVVTGKRLNDEGFHLIGKFFGLGHCCKCAVNGPS